MKLPAKRLVFPLLATLAALTAMPLSAAAGEESLWSWEWFSFERLKGVKPVDNESYQEECSACHFAYPPGLLPKRSWQKLLSAGALADHFGENAELDEETRSQIEEYVLANAADNSLYKRSRKVMASLPEDATPLRITDVRYIKRKHEEIPDRLISGNPLVGSRSNCNNCHTKANEGIFDDATVFIKGHGRWDEDDDE